ncbi:MAG: hypothetical protein C0602_07450 [Denitrovibrio sp.]|nr:MAG: hypothetical protein C0602_07450 [Denitrovibrio sp.]
MRKLSLIYIMLFMFVSAAWSADAAGVLAQLEKIKTYTADFVQTTEIEGFGEDEYSGKLFIISSEKALWDYDDPYRQFYLFDTSTMKYYDSDTKQMIIQKLDPATNVFMRLMLNPSDIRNDFDVKLEGSKLMLRPKDDLGLEQIVFEVKNGIVTGILTKDQNGNNTDIELNNIKIDKSIDPKIFDPAVPEGTEVFEY